MRDAVVIGAGLAGLAATIRLARAGLDVTLVTKGIGGLQLGQGTIDVLGYAPDRVEDPLAGVDAVAAAHPEHPYAHFTGAQVGGAVAWLADLLGEDALVGDASRNVVLPTAIGALRPTTLVPPSMIAGRPGGGRTFAVVGLRRLKDFHPRLVADNLARQQAPDGTPIRARALWVDLEVRPGEVDTSGVNHARALDHPEARERLVRAIRPLLHEGETVLLPAVLGLKDPHAWREVAEGLGHDVAEVPLPPPSVPGMRLNEALTARIKSTPGARLVLGSKVRGVDVDHSTGAITSVTVGTAGHATVVPTASVVLAAGGFESGALAMDSWGRVTDTVLGLPLRGTEGQLVHGDYWGADQPLFLAGVAVDDDMRPLDEEGGVVHPNLRAAGGVLAGSTRWREKSGDGIALASALRAADSIIGSK